MDAFEWMGLVADRPEVIREAVERTQVRYARRVAMRAEKNLWAIAEMLRAVRIVLKRSTRKDRERRKRIKRAGRQMLRQARARQGVNRGGFLP